MAKYLNHEWLNRIEAAAKMSIPVKKVTFADIQKQRLNRKIPSVKEFTAAVKASISNRDLIARLGWDPNSGSSHKVLKKLFEVCPVNTEHFVPYLRRNLDALLNKQVLNSKTSDCTGEFKTYRSCYISPAESKSSPNRTLGDEIPSRTAYGSTYPGSSEGKNHARAAAYGSIRQSLFKQGYHVVIASRECGDIHYLKSKGIKPDKIIACDRDPVAVEQARAEGVLIPEGEAAFDIVLASAWALAKFGKRVATVNVDLCGTLQGRKIRNLQQGGVHTFSAVLSTVGPGIACFLTFIRAHDKVNSPHDRYRNWEKSLPKDRKPTVMIPYLGAGGCPMMVVGCS